MPRIRLLLERNFTTEKFLLASILSFILSYYIAWGWQEQFIYVLFPIAFALNIRKQERTLPSFTVNLVLIVFLTLLISTSSLWSVNSGKYLWTSIRYGAAILFSLICFYWYFGKLDFEKKLKTLLIAIVISSTLVVILSFIFNPFVPGVDRLTHFSFTGITKNPNNSGLYVGVSSLFAIYFLRKTENLKIFSALLAILALHFIFLILTKSRGAISFFVICYVVQLVLTRATSIKRELVINVPILVSAMIFYVLFSSDIENRIHDPYYRLELLSHGWDIIKNNFWFGDGLNYDFRLQVTDGHIFSKVHNSFIQTFQNSGIFAFSMLILLTSRLVIAGLKHKSDLTKLVALWLMFGAMYMVVDGGVIVIRPSKLWFNYWIPAFILLSIEFYEKPKKK